MPETLGTKRQLGPLQVLVVPMEIESLIKVIEKMRSQIRHQLLVVIKNAIFETFFCWLTYE